MPSLPAAPDSDASAGIPEYFRTRLRSGGKVDMNVFYSVARAACLQHVLLSYLVNGVVLPY